MRQDASTDDMEAFREEYTIYDGLKKQFDSIKQELEQAVLSQQEKYAKGSWEDSNQQGARIEYNNAIRNRDAFSKQDSWIQSPYYAKFVIRDQDDDETVCYLGESDAPDEIRMQQAGVVYFSYGAQANGKQSKLAEELSTAFENHSVSPIELKSVDLRTGEQACDLRYEFTQQREIFIASGYLEDVKHRFPVGTQMTAEVTDLFLQELLIRNANSTSLQSIIRSIQKQQSEIIKLGLDKHILINGCAGSGKTQILLHRLYYHRVKLKQIGWENILFLTPGEHLIRYASNLFEHFQLYGIHRRTLLSYYIEKFQHCDQYNASHYSIRTEEYDLPENYLQKIYSEQLNDSLQATIERFISDLLGEVTAYLNLDYSGCQDLTDIGKLHYARQQMNALKKQLKQDSEYVQLEQECNRLTNLISQANKDIQEKQMSLQKTDLSEKEENKEQKKIRKKEEKIQSYETLLHETTTKKCNALRRMGLSDIISLRRTKELVRLIGILPRYLFEAVIWPKLCAVRERFHVQTMESGLHDAKPVYILYKRDLIIYLNILFRTERLSPDSYRFVCVDEAQDYHPFDYRLMKRFFPHAVFNVMGDKEQLFNSALGTVLGENHLAGIQFETFFLNQNYRSDRRIINYCNNRFGKHIVGFWQDPQKEPCVSIIGSIQSNVIQWLRREPEQTAVIVKGKDAYQVFAQMVHAHSSIPCRYIDSDSDIPAPDAINIYCVRIVKGLEFHSVLVFGSGMNDREKYVACSRARMELFCFQVD